MTQTEKQWWEQIRARGEARFVLRQGLLRCGLPFAVFVTMGRLLLDFFADRPMGPIWTMGIAFVFYAVFFGGCMGAMAWRNHERDFQKPTEADDVAA